MDDKFSSDVYPFYLWSPSRQAPLVMSSSGRLSWDAGISSRVVTNFGKTPSLTVWQLRKV